MGTTTSTLHFYGEGDGIGMVAPGRDLIGRGWPDPEVVYANGPATFGDSGAGIITDDGRALGLVSGAGGNDVTTDPAETVRINRFAGRIRAASDALSVALELQTAPLLNAPVTALANALACF